MPTLIATAMPDPFRRHQLNGRQPLPNHAASPGFIRFRMAVVVSVVGALALSVLANLVQLERNGQLYGQVARQHETMIAARDATIRALKAGDKLEAANCLYVFAMLKQNTRSDDLDEAFIQAFDQLIEEPKP